MSHYDGVYELYKHTVGDQVQFSAFTRVYKTNACGYFCLLPLRALIHVQTFCVYMHVFLIGVHTPFVEQQVHVWNRLKNYPKIKKSKQPKALTTPQAN